MNAGELYDAFREDVGDVHLPYLWSVSEIWRYANDAHRMFIRLTGGIQDFTSKVTAIPIIANEAVSSYDSSILRILSATVRSTGLEIKLINYTDLGKPIGTDYGIPRTLKLDNTTGDVHSGVIGMEQNKIRWINVPAVNDCADLIVRRLPMNKLVNDSDELEGVHEDHHTALLDWMKYKAYLKQDADTFDKGRAEACRMIFDEYCRSIARLGLERLKHKKRSVAYGGL